MTGTPRAWISIPLPKPHELSGYAEAKAKADAGIPLFPVRVKGAPRARRSAESLTAERDRLIAQRARLGVTSSDPAAARLSHGDARRQQARLDRELPRYTKLTARIDALEYRIRKEGDR